MLAFACPACKSELAAVTTLSHIVHFPESPALMNAIGRSRGWPDKHQRFKAGRKSHTKEESNNWEEYECAAKRWPLWLA
jgi:hypothetical protein